MCKKKVYKAIRQLTNKAIGIINLSNPDVIGPGYYSDARKHDAILVKEALMGFTCVTYDVLQKISGQNSNDRFEVFVQALIEDLTEHNIVWFITELKEQYDNYVSLLSKITRGIYIYQPDSASYVIQWMHDLGMFNINTYDYERTKVTTKCVAQILLFLSKIELEGDKDRLEAEAINKWLETEKGNKQQDIFEKDSTMFDHVYMLLSEIVDYWLNTSHFKVNLDNCCNGSGGTNMNSAVQCSSKNPLNKWLNMEINAECKYLLESLLSDREIREVNPFMRVTHRDLISKFITVAKNATARRGISTEPPGLQFLQQAVRRSLVKYIKMTRDRHPNAIGNYLFLEDNTYNRALAQWGSVTNDFATIDLSSASDGVRLSMVKKIMARVPQLLKWLCATRTKYTLVGKKLHKTSKFAGMGSGTCFITECIVFLAISWLGCYARKTKRSIWIIDAFEIRSAIRSPKWAETIKLLVFGDDIIVEEDCYQSVTSLLELLGFQVNHKKSFKHGLFKESCGGNYFNGIDITPLKWNVSFGSETIIGPEAFSGLIDYANLAYRKELPILREHCIQRLLTSGNYPEFTGDLDDSSRIYSPTPTNFHLKYRSRNVKISGTKLLDHRGWPKHVWFHERVELYTRVQYRCTTLKAVPEDQNDIDFWNSPISFDMEKYGYTTSEGNQWVSDRLSYIAYLESTTRCSGDMPHQIDVYKHHDGVHRVYHLVDPVKEVEKPLEDHTQRKMLRFKEI